MVSCAVLSIVMLLAYQILIYATRYLRESTARVDGQRDAMRVLVGVSREIRESSLRSVYCVDEVAATIPAGVVFGCARRADGTLALDGTGSPLWPNLICYARVGSDLWRWTQDLLTPTSSPPDPNALGRGVVYFSGQSAGRRRYAPGFKSFRVSKLASPSRVRVDLRTSHLDGAVEIQLQTDIVSGP